MNVGVAAARIETSPAGLDRWVSFGLGAWAGGVLVAEPIASVGMAMCAAGALWSARADLRGAARSLISGWWPIIAFIAWALIAPAISGRPPSGSGVARTMDWLGVPLAAWCVTRMGASRVEGIVRWVVGVLLVSCVVAGLQHFGIWPGPEQMRVLAFTRIPFERVYEIVPGTADRYMAGGLLFHRLKFAHVGGLAVVALVAFGMAASGRRRGLLLGAAALAFGAILAFPFARAAAAALLLSCAGVIVLSIRRRRLALALGAAVIAAGAAVVVGYAPLRERFLRSATAEGSGDRHLLVAAGLRAASEHPLTGVGPGRFRSGEWAAADAPVHVREQVGKAHNQFLSMAAETGVPGAILFVIMLGAIARRWALSSAQGVAGAGALCFFVLLSMVHDPLFQAPFSMALPLLLGIGVQRRSSTR